MTHGDDAPLAVLLVDRRFEDDGAMLSSPGERCVDLGDPDPNEMGQIAPSLARGHA